MKKREKSILLYTAMIFLLLIASANCLEIKLSKDSYQPGETLQAEITGNFVSLKLENVLIYKTGVPRSNPVVSDLTYQDGIYYYYAILPKQEGNFSLRIEDSQYFQDEEVKSNIIIKNFSIRKTNQSALSFNPGFVVTDKDFSIKFKSLNGNSELKSNFEATQATNNLSLIEGVETPVDFSISNLEPMKTLISVNNYQIKVFITKEGNKTSITEQTDFTFYPSEIKATLLAGNSYYYEFKLFNIGDNNLTKINLSNNLNLILLPDKIQSLNTKSYAKINFTITPGKDIQNISGQIIATIDKKNASLPIFFKITEKTSDVNLTTGSQIDCNDIGKQCSSTETCNGVMRDSKQGACCMGNCITVTQPSSNGLYIGIGIFLVVLIILYFFYIKIKKRQKPKTTEEFLKERTDEYRERLKGNTGTEVNKRLDRI